MLNQENQISEMHADILAIPNIMKSLFEGLNRATRTAFSYEDILSTRRIILTGCGDSYFAGIAAKYSFERYSKIPAFSAPAMETSRYLLNEDMFLSPNNPLVLGVSASGEIARVIETLQRAKQIGAPTCLITGNPNSRAGQASERIVQVPKIPKRSSNVHVPGTSSFTASLMALYMLAYHMAEVRDALPVEKVNQLGEKLLTCADTVENVIARVTTPVAELVSDWSDSRHFFILGSGPSYATAMFTAAKMVEAAGVVAVGLDIEEWAHFYNFSSDMTIPILSRSGMRVSRDAL